MEAENQNPPEDTATAGASSAGDEMAKENEYQNGSTNVGGEVRL